MAEHKAGGVPGPPVTIQRPPAWCLPSWCPAAPGPSTHRCTPHLGKCRREVITGAGFRLTCRDVFSCTDASPGLGPQSATA